MKKLFTISALLICIATKAQNFVWSKSMGGTTNDQGRVICVDNSGSVITAGLFTGTADFDPGPGTYTMTSAGAEDIYMCKLTAAGAFVWAVRFGNNTGTFPGTGEKIGSIITDASNNVYAIGTFSSTVDFNPGAGTNNLTSVGAYDVFVSKFDANGSYLWAKQIGSSSSDMGNGIDIDNTGIYLTGYTSSGADFNPSATTNTVTNGGGVDIFVCKWDLNGNYLWAQGMGGTYVDAGYGIKVNPVNNNVYTTGHFGGTADLSPGTSGPPTLTSAGNDDIFISSLNATSGAYSGQAAMGGTGNDYGLSLNIDASGNIYTTGSFTLSCDFDPGIAPVFLNSSGGTDAFVSKLTSSLTYLWAKQIDSPGTDEGESLVLDAYGNVYSTGYFNGVADFDPSASTFTISSTGQDAYVWKISPSGNLVWAKSWGSSSSVIGNCICLDAIANIYTTGYYNSTCDFDPGAGTYSITTAGGLDSYVSKLSCTLPQTVTTNAPLTLSLCIGTSTSIPSSMTSILEANVTYYWSAVGASSVNLSQTTGTTTTASFTASSSFSIVVTATNTCGTTTTTVSDITVNALPLVTATASPTLICDGSPAILSGGGASTYTWSPFISNGTPVIHFMGDPTSYTITGTDANGCVNTSTLYLSIVANPTITITGKNLVCLNNSNTLIASGAVTYTWLPGSVTNSTINAQPASNTVYTVNAQDNNGCRNSTTFSLEIVIPQTPDICEVTVDSLSQYNQIIWDKTPYTNVDSFIVYREVSTNIYRRIGAQDKNALSLFIDTVRSIGPANGNPNITSYRYELQLRDSCGNYSAFSPFHNSIYFTTNSTGTFFWNTYSVQGQPTPVSTFDLIRDNNATGTWTVVGSCAGTQTFLNDPAFASYPNAIYRVIGNGFNCNPTAKTLQQVNKSKSNIKNNFNTPLGLKIIDFNELVFIAPNPAITELVISFKEEIKTITKIAITDVLGKVIFNSELNSGNSIFIPVNELSKGIYFLKIDQGKNYMVKKFIKE